MKVRLRYFDPLEGKAFRQLLDRAAELTAEAFPYVVTEAEPEVMQYENVAYTMYPSLDDLIVEAAEKEGVKLTPRSERGGTTAPCWRPRDRRAAPASTVDNRLSTASTSGLAPRTCTRWSWWQDPSSRLWPTSETGLRYQGGKLNQRLEKEPKIRKGMNPDMRKERNRSLGKI